MGGGLATHLGVVIQQAAAVRAGAKAIHEDDGLRDQVLWQAEEDAGGLQQLGGGETDGGLEGGGDAVELRGGRLQLGGGGEGVCEMRRLRDWSHAGGSQ